MIVRIDKRVYARRALNTDSEISWEHVFARMILNDRGHILEFDLNVKYRPYLHHYPLVRKGSRRFQKLVTILFYDDSADYSYCYAN